MLYFYAIYNLKLPFVLLILAIASAALAEPNAVNPVFEPGKEVRLNAGKGAGEILVYVPSDYNNDCNWPVIFYYHGQGGKLSTQWLQTATGGKGFIIVSLEFIESPPETMSKVQYRLYIEKEMKNFAYVRHFLQGQLKINPKMTILAGISRGGWLVADIFLLRPRMAAAAAILCAGYNNWVPVDAASLAGRYVYIGAGEKDMNLEAAKKANRYFTNRNADVTFEIYGGLGHTINPKAPKLLKWFSDLRSSLNRTATEMKSPDKAKEINSSADFNSSQG
jgi:poly(3-hydroxybutyrate) depolymerase